MFPGKTSVSSDNLWRGFKITFFLLFLIKVFYLLNLCLMEPVLYLPRKACIFSSGAELKQNVSLYLCLIQALRFFIFHFST